MNCMQRFFCALLLLGLSHNALSSGQLFSVSASGTPVNVTITLCLNGRAALSCETQSISGTHISISATVPNKNYPAAGLKINSPGYVATGCSPIGNGYCLFSLNATSPSNIVLNADALVYVGGIVSGLYGTVVLQNNGTNPQRIQSNGFFTFSTPLAEGSSYDVTVQTQPANQTCLVANGTGVIGIADISNVSVNCGQLSAYVAQSPSIYQCSVNSAGSLYSCLITPSTGAPVWYPISVTLAVVNGVQYAYVTSVFNNVGTVYQCSVNPVGNLYSCIITPSTGAPAWNPVSVTLAVVNGVQYAYVPSASDIYQCVVNAVGELTSCAITPSSGAPVWYVANISFAVIEGVQYAYVSSNDGSFSAQNVYQCRLNSLGNLTNCAITPSTGAPAWSPLGTTFATIEGTQYAYVTDDSGGNSGNVYQCRINSLGDLNSCAITLSIGAPIGVPAATTFAIINGIQYAYVSAGNGIYQCSVNSAGNLTSCTITGAPISSSSSLAFAAS